MGEKVGRESANFMNQGGFCLLGWQTQSAICRSVAFVLIAFALGFSILSHFAGLYGSEQNDSYMASMSSSPNILYSNIRGKFLEVPQIVWGLNNQKIAFARACLTARLLNRTLLMPRLSASLFYKEVDQLKPISFDKVFKFEKFNSLCRGFIQLGQASDISNLTETLELLKGSGRRWTAERDLSQLKLHKEAPYDKYEVIRINGKNPFLWHDHWPVKDYAKIFGCLEFVDEITNEASKVISKIKEVGLVGGSITHSADSKSANSSRKNVPYIAVHMRIEKDWMIHCKNMEQRLNIKQICSNKEEIMERASKISGFTKPIIAYLAVADSLLEDGLILSGWKEGILPFEKKRLGVWDIYKKYPYLIQSAIDFEVCSRADIFLGNSFSTFSSLVVLERTQRLIEMGVTETCGVDVNATSYAYNILGDFGGPQKWMTNMADSSLKALSYGTNNISCKSFFETR